MAGQAIGSTIHLNVIARGLACLASAIAAVSILPNVLNDDEVLKIYSDMRR